VYFYPRAMTVHARASARDFSISLRYHAIYARGDSPSPFFCFIFPPFFFLFFLPFFLFYFIFFLFPARLFEARTHPVRATRIDN